MTSGEHAPAGLEYGLSYDESSPEAARAGELLTVSPEVAATLRPQLWDTIDRSIQATVSEHERLSLHQTGLLLDWRMFGAPGEPLPDGLIMSDADGDTRVLSDYRLGITSHCISVSLRDLKLHGGLKDIVEAARDDLETREPELESTFVDMLKGNPVVQYLRSFDTRMPQSAERPLTPFMRAIREAQLEHDVRETHGLDPRQPIPLHSPAASMLQRGRWQLDDETMRAPLPETSDAFERAREYFGNRIAQAYFERSLPEPEEGDANAVFRAFMEQGTDHPAIDYADDVASKIVAELEGEPGYLSQFDSDAGESFLHSFMTQQLFDNNRSSTDYKTLFEEQLKNTAKYLREATHEIDEVANGLITDLREWFMRPTGPALPVKEIEEHERNGYRHNHRTSTSFVPWDIYERQRQTRVGYIESGQSDGSRLILQSSRREDLERPTPDTDLVISLWADSFADADPQIPGYTLTSRYGELYGFMRNESDPYAVAAVGLNADQRASLTETYQSLEMHDLASAITDHPELTVAELVQLVRNNSTYAFPQYLASSYDGFDVSQGAFPRNFHAESIQDYKNFVHEGILHVQCSGAADFLKYSLRTVFGDQSAATVGGLVIGRSPAIHAAGHAQTTFTYDGQVYILDATPASAHTGDYASTGSNDDLPPARVEAFAPPEPPKSYEQSTNLSADPELIRLEELRGIRRTLESHLEIIM